MRFRIPMTALACAALAVAVSSVGPALASSPGAGHTWTIAHSPNRGGGAESSLQDISCPSATACVAVGFSSPRTGDSSRTLTETWNGTTWTIAPSPSPATTSLLDGVSCRTASACTAVGYDNAYDHGDKTLVETWNGTTWTKVASPSPDGYNFLYGVSCASATFCFAVGVRETLKATDVKTLTETWNGTAWTVVPSPSPATGSAAFDTLSSVSCTAPNACTAVGYYLESNQLIPHALVETWNGTRWTLDTTPAVANPILTGVSCTSAHTCTAVGTQGASKPLIETWNGTTWTAVSIPNPYTAESFTGVSCRTTEDCVAVGNHSVAGSNDIVPLAASWNGTTWTIDTTPGKTGTGSYLTAVSCPSATSCTAGGFYNTPYYSRTLIETGS